MSDSSKFVSDRTIDLDAVGTKRNMLFYATDNVKVQEVQVDSLIGKYRQSLTSSAFGSSSEVTVPNDNSISSVYLYLKIDNIPIGSSVSEFAAHGMIRSCNFTWGSSSVSTVELSGEALWMHNMLCMETSEKRKKYSELAQSALAKSVTVYSIECEILIPLPWSTIRADMNKKPYDTSMLNNNILIQLNFNDSNSFFGNHAASLVFPTSFSKTLVVLKEAVLTNKRDSMRQTLLQNPSLMVPYPFTHKSTGTRKFITNSPVLEPVNIVLQSFLESDLLGVAFFVVATAQERANHSLPFSAVNKFNTIRLRDIILTYNGQQLFNLEHHLSDMMLVNIDVGSPDCPKTIISNDAAGLAVPNGSYHVYYLPFTQYKSVIFSEEYNNVSRYASQTLELTFTPEGLIAPTNLSFHSLYYYNAIAQTQQGVTSLQFA